MRMRSGNSRNPTFAASMTKTELANALTAERAEVARLRQQVKDLEYELDTRVKDARVMTGNIRLLEAERDAWRNRYRKARYVWRQRHWEQRGMEASLSMVMAEQAGSVDVLQAENARLRQQLAATLAAALAAAQWQPVTAETAPVHISRPFKAVVQMSREGDLFIAQPDANGVMSDDATVIMLRPGPNHAFCERNPAAQVWMPVAAYTTIDCDGDKISTGRDGLLELVGSDQNGNLDEHGQPFTVSAQLPPTKRLCELVTAGDAAESEGA